MDEAGYSLDLTALPYQWRFCFGAKSQVSGTEKDET